MDTLVKTLKASVSADIEKLGVLKLTLNSTQAYNSKFQLSQLSGNYTVKCVSGTLYTDDTYTTVLISEGGTQSFTGSKYFYIKVNTTVTIEVYDAYKLGLLNLSSLGLSPNLRVQKLSKYTNLYKVVNLSSFIGVLEDFIEDSCKYGRTIDITIENYWVVFNTGASQIHGTTYFCDFATDSSVVTVKNTNSSGSVLGTYNKATGVWTYA